MVRISKQAERRNKCPKKTKKASPKSGPKKDNLKAGYKEHANASPLGEATFIPKIK